MGSDREMRLLTTTLRQFQSTLPHGERLLPPRYQQALCLRFNPRSHMGSDMLPFPTPPFPKGFNPRSHMGSDIPITRNPRITEGFNPRSHMGSDTWRLKKFAALSSFNPRSHMGSDLNISCCKCYFNVSIHAPTWGATQITKDRVTDVKFQSTLPHGERRILHHFVIDKNEFQSTLPHGERQIIREFPGTIARFQSTLPHGERHCLLKMLSAMPSFNPRSHMGSD